MGTVSNQSFDFLRWVKNSFWGWFTGIALILFLSSFFEAVGIQDLQFYLGLGMGAGLGFFQWLFLYKHFGFSKNWIWFSIGGMTLPFLLIDLLFPNPADFKLPAAVSLGGLCLGTMQYFILKKHFKKSAWWILASTAGWTMAIATVLGVDYTKYLDWMNLVVFAINLFLILAGGAVLGIITGLGLKKILGE